MKTTFRTIAVTMVVLACALSAEAAGPLTKKASLPLGTRAHDLVIAGNLAYVATDDGLTIVDITTPAAPFVRGSIDLGGKSFGVAMQDGGCPPNPPCYAYVANQMTDFNVVDVSDPDDPALVAKRTISGSAWDVAVKDDVAYVTSFGGELYLFRISNLPTIEQIRVLGLVTWTSAGQDETQLAKLRNQVTSGGAKATGVSVTGNSLVAVDWNYGQLYYYDVTDADAPKFRGTHHAPFTFRPEVNPTETVAFMLAVFGNSSGVYSVPLDTLNPFSSTRHANCTECDYFKSPATDYGGLTVSSNGKYVIYIAGKVGVVQVLNVQNPADITNAGSLKIGSHGMKTGESMGVQSRGDYIFTAAGLLGLEVFQYPGLSN